jgi:hypothetical protein
MKQITFNGCKQFGKREKCWQVEAVCDASSGRGMSKPTTKSRLCNYEVVEELDEVVISGAAKIAT